jgi:hypothetical protein
VARCSAARQPSSDYGHRYANPTIVGRLVSEDGKAALITAAFHEERLNYAALFQRTEQ